MTKGIHPPGTLVGYSTWWVSMLLDKRTLNLIKAEDGTTSESVEGIPFHITWPHIKEDGYRYSFIPLELV